MTDPFAQATSYEEMLDRGLQLTGEDKRYYIDGRLQALQDQLPDNLVPQSLLDFGCGTGETAAALADRFPGVDVLGVDVSAPSITEASRRHHGAPVEFGLIDAVGTRQFDICYLNGAVHHIPRAERPGVFARLRTAVRPGGLIAVFENTPWNPGTRLVMHRIPFDRDAQPVAPRTIRRLLHEADFGDAFAVGYLFVFPSSLARLRRYEPMLTRVPLGGQYYVMARG